MYKKILLFLSILLLSVTMLYAAGDLDSVSFVTYYPSPYGSYNEMRVNKLSVGSNYHDYSGTTIADNSLIVEGNVGIGIVTPVHPLDVRNTSGATQIHVSGTGNDDGLYIEGYNLDASASNISSGSSFNGTNWEAKANAASIISQNQGAIGFYGNPGLTKGGIYTPTMHMFINSNGNVGIGTPIPAAGLDVKNGFIHGGFDCQTVEGPWAAGGWSFATCAADEWLLTGGGTCDNGTSCLGTEGGQLLSSMPSYSDNRWQVWCQAWNWGPGVACGKAYAVCCKK